MRLGRHSRAHRIKGGSPFGEFLDKKLGKFLLTCTGYSRTEAPEASTVFSKKKFRYWYLQYRYMSVVKPDKF
jgi:hypothetical protein